MEVMKGSSSSGVNDDMTFRVSFSDGGVGNLRATLSAKLTEFMGDYTDDTLVEYVIVLLRNGRRKDEAKNELNVFLGDSTDSFVTWLWDHLVSNLDQDVLPPESKPEEVPKTRLAKTEHARIRKFAPHTGMDAASDRGTHEKSPKARHLREWKGVSRKVTLPSAVDRCDVETCVPKEGRTYVEDRRRKHSVSPEPSGRKKRSHAEDPKWFKESVPRGSIRLLQFAVRDAVATSIPSHSTSEPASKRLRSVVSSSIADTTYKSHPQRPQSVAIVSNASATAIRSAAEASEDVMKKNKASGNVFDRLSRCVDEEESSRQVLTHMVDEYDDFDQIQQGSHDMDQQINVNGGKYVGPRTMIVSNSGLDSFLASDIERYDRDNVMSRGITNVSSIGASGAKKHDDSMMQYSVAENFDKARRPSQTRTPVSSVAMASSSRKIVNISVNVNTWKPSHYQSLVEVKGPEARNFGDTVTGKSSMRPMKQNSNLLTYTGNGEPAAEKRKTLLSVSGSYSTIPPLDDADSRTIFVNNVHFAATKDSLCRHFNKFGGVLKATILTDPATGQPKGSAYVEFMRKETAEAALSLDGASFMSRILKVVRKSAAPHEASPSTTWPPVSRGSPFAVPRIARATFPRVFRGAYRARPLLKPCPKSLQWKRDAQPTSAQGPTSSSSVLNIAPSPSPRSLTYVRPELKANGNRVAT